MADPIWDTNVRQMPRNVCWHVGGAKPVTIASARCTATVRINYIGP